MRTVHQNSISPTTSQFLCGSYKLWLLYILFHTLFHNTVPGKISSIFHSYTYRDAVNEDKKKVLLKLDNSSRKLKTCSSEGKIGKSFEGRSSKLGDPRRTYSYNAPFASSLERIADCSIKGVS